jgi:hypothetical protein
MEPVINDFNISLAFLQGKFLAFKNKGEGVKAPIEGLFATIFQLLHLSFCLSFKSRMFYLVCPHGYERAVQESLPAGMKLVASVKTYL